MKKLLIGLLFLSLNSWSVEFGKLEKHLKLSPEDSRSYGGDFPVCKKDSKCVQEKCEKKKVNEIGSIHSLSACRKISRVDPVTGKDEFLFYEIDILVNYDSGKKVGADSSKVNLNENAKAIIMLQIR